MVYPHSMDEHVAASAVAALATNGKRCRDDSPDAAGGAAKVARTSLTQVGPALPPPIEQEQNVEAENNNSLKAYPYFYYRDFSTQCDPDPLAPLTPPGRVPNFPAKMHSILSRPDLADIVAWMPHGRSWRVLKPREFEIRVIPTYFEHAKFSSFIRQANGWGFRRITQGRDRNSYYHEMFLRGLPHLCKMMKRPGVSEKQAADPEHEPDFYKISEENPVPEKADDDSILLQCTLQGGPKARMPIYLGAFSSTSMSTAAAIYSSSTVASSGLESNAVTSPMKFQMPKVTPNDHLALNSFQQSISASDNQVCNMGYSNVENAAKAQQPQISLPQPAFLSTPASLHMAGFAPQANSAPTAAVSSSEKSVAFPMISPPNMAAALQASNAASQFAAGFAAATALSHQQFRSILGQALAAAHLPNVQGAVTFSTQN
jgi:hypothetical protein